MLVRFKVKNFLSYNKETEVLLSPGVVRQHQDHVVKSEKSHGIDILKHSIFYGANASGKSNLVKAIAYAKKMVIAKHTPFKSIPVKPFKLIKKYKNKDTMFEFEIKYQDKFYAYGFEFNHERIQEEWAYEINKKNERKLFTRQTESNGKININFSIKLNENKKRINYIAEDTRPNQLFINALNERNVKEIKEIEPFIQILKWFSRTLIIIQPETKFLSTEINLKKNQRFTDLYTNFLQYFDTGIRKVKCKKIKRDGTDMQIPYSKGRIDNIFNNMNKNSYYLRSEPNKERYAFYKTNDDEEQILKIITEHSIKESDSTIEFDLNEESDGTIRMMDIIPLLIQAQNYDLVFIIDELDRSLHTALIYKLINTFSEINKNRSSQLLATTHDTGLLNLKLLRRDEIWFIEKNSNGESQVYSLDDFKPRPDKDIEKGYILGRYGAIPFLSSNLSWLEKE